MSCVSAFNKLVYEITYDTVGEEKGIAGSTNLTGESTFSRNNLLLGTCSEYEGKMCVYDSGITKINLKVVVIKTDETSQEIAREISY